MKSPAIRFLQALVAAALSALAGCRTAADPMVAPAGDRSGPSPQGYQRSVRCIFRSAPPPTTPSVCRVELLMSKHYRTLAACQGVAACSLGFWPTAPDATVRLWSPDSLRQVEARVSALPSQLVFPVFKREAKVTKGPWVCRATATEACVRWETAIPALSFVRVVNRPLEVPHLWRWVSGASSCSAPGGPCLHTVTMKRLLPAHAYNFVVGDAMPAPAGGSHPGGSLATASGTAGSPFAFSVLGDVQGGAAWSDVAAFTGALQSIPGRGLGPVLHTGDMVSSSTGWDQWFARGSGMLSQHPFHPALGNNDDGASFRRYFVLAPAGPAASYYSFNYQNTHFVMLDTAAALDCGSGSPQADWLRADLASAAAHNAANIVIATHWGPLNYGGYGDNAALGSCLDSLFVGANQGPSDLFLKLRLVVGGHQHMYERIVKSRTVGGMTRKFHHLTVGTAGADPRCPDQGPDLKASSANNCNPPNGIQNHQGIVIDVRGTTIEGRAYNFAFDSSGNPVLVPVDGGELSRYSVLDCFAFDANGNDVPPASSCSPQPLPEPGLAPEPE